jgi:hypothetical protein
LEFFWPLSGVAFMARYDQSYVGERRTASVHVQLTPDERAELETAAAERGAASLSAFVRTLCLRRLADVARVAGARRDPDAQRLMYELKAIGNNLNQLTHIANTVRDMPAGDELRAVTGLLKAAMARVLAL